MAVYKRVGTDGRTVRWQTVVELDDGSGRRKRRVVGTYRTKKEAEAAERATITNRDEGKLLEKNRITVNQLLDRWLMDKAGTVSANTLADYRHTCTKHIYPSPLGQMQIRRVNPTDVQEQYVAWRAAGRSPHLVRSCHTRLSQAFTYAVKMKLLLHNPVKDASPPQRVTAPFDHWDADESRRFLEAAQRDVYAPLWDVLLREGMRRGEALGLRWRDINWESGTAHIVQIVTVDKANGGGAMVQSRTKTRAGARLVRLTAGTLAALRAHKDRRSWGDNEATKPTPDGLIFCVQAGGPINPTNLHRNFDAIVRAAGLRRIKIHQLRHTAATLMLLAGISAKVVSERLGHANISITLDIYSHVMPSMQDDAAAAMDRLLG